MERPLLRLPRLSGRDAVYRLPLSDTSAAALHSALLEDNPVVRAARFDAVLRTDPALTVWCSVHPKRKSAPRDFQELASWLDEHALAVLRWSSVDLLPPEGDESHSLARCDARTARSLALSEAAERLATPEAAGRARLLAFLSHAYEWLISCSTPRGADDLEQFAPPWLRRLIAEVRETSVSNDPAMQAVRRALQGLDFIGDAPGSPTAPSQDSRWAAEALPRLASRLARLEELESRFQAVLRREKLASLQ
jgi:hypothetical protein